MRVAGIPLGVGQNMLNPSSSTLALLHFDGANGSTTFVDSSIYNRTITTIGSPVISTATSVSGGSSLLLQGWPGGVDGLRAIIPENGLGVVTTKTWTIEGYVKIDVATHTNAGIVGIYSGLSREYVGLYYGKLRVGDAGLTGYASNVDFSGALLSTSVFNKIKITGDGTNIKLYIDDSLILTVAYPAWANASLENSLAFGKSFATHVQGGYYDEWKAVKELHTFDPSLTLALLHFDGANNSTVFTDSSPFNQTVAVVTGTPKISTAMSRFGGSSLYLDGSSSIKIPNNANLNLGTGAFTIEFWFYLPSLPSSDAWFLHKSGSPQQAISISHSTRQLFSGFLSASLVSAATITAGAWHHVAVVRESANGQIKQYFNGLNEGTMNNSGSVDNAGDLTIGSWFSGSDAITGYIDEFRIRKEAMYLANFTPPTQPFTY